jgi:hypothetical protein
VKATRIKVGQIVNPFFSHDARRLAQQQGVAYDVKPFLDLPIGELVEDPDCWKLCIGDDPALKPADDECREKVLAVMGSEKRSKFLQNLKRQNQAEVRKQMGKSQLEWLDSMLETYGREVAALDAPAAPTARTKPAAAPAATNA